MTYLKEIKEMLALMNENNLAELEIEKDGLRIKLKRITSAHEAQGLTVSSPIAIEKTSSVQSKPLPETQPQVKTIQIKSPMVGTFYRAPSPDAPAFVDVNSEIEIGQIICIIEAMKLMNEIKSEVKGTILEILIENGRPVEFSQPLFIIEPK